MSEYWEVPQPEIKSLCKRCIKTVWGSGVYQDPFGVVSPSGIAHIGEDGGDTACGIDATGLKWWWRL